MRLEGKVAVITGTGSGMGRAMANLFAGEGAKIVAAEWNATALAEVVAEVTAAGGAITGVAGDVSNRDDDRRIIQIANLALYLASDESRFVNGAIVHIDAGWSAA